MTYFAQAEKSLNSTWSQLNRVRHLTAVRKALHAVEYDRNADWTLYCQPELSWSMRQRYLGEFKRTHIKESYLRYLEIRLCNVITDDAICESQLVAFRQSKTQERVFRGKTEMLKSFWQENVSGVRQE